MRVIELAVVSLLFSSLSPVSHAQDAPPLNSALNGNWHIAGGRGPRQSPNLTLSIGVVGNTAYGSGQVGLDCKDARGGVGSGFFVMGQITPDGKFELTNRVPSNSDAAAHPPFDVTIRGTIPARDATNWTGVYKIHGSLTRCGYEASSNFIATRYPPLHGTYVGAISAEAFGSGVTASVQVAQTDSSTTPEALLEMNAFRWMRNSNTTLTATITVSDSPCFKSGTTTAPSEAKQVKNPSGVSGDQYFLNFLMDDGSTLSLDGWYVDPSESTLILARFSVWNGSCRGEFHWGVLTKE